MRRLLLALLLASAATPAFADDNPRRGEGRRGVSAERAERDESAEGERQVTRAERPKRNVQIERDVELRREPVTRPEHANQRALSARPPSGLESQRLGNSGERTERRVAGDTVREWRMRERQRSDSPIIEEGNARRAPSLERTAQIEERIRRAPRREKSASIEERNVRRAPGPGGSTGEQLVQPRRPLPRVFDSENRRVSRAPVFGTEPPPPRTAGLSVARPTHRWSSDWRRDRRYNWWDWRRRHRSLFHLGFYNDPFGWDYFRYGSGWRLWPSYYRSSFWLHDPWMYRLPPAYGPYRWVRYWDDALLVNIYTGHVVDVIHNFFW